MLSYESYGFSKEIRKKLKPLYQSNNYRAILGLMYDYVVIALAVLLGSRYLFLYPLAVLVIGARQRAFATILHDASHLCLTKNKKLNYILGTYFSGYLIGQEFYNYKDSHVKGHHTHLGNPEKDPDYKYHLEIGLYKLKDKNHFLYKYVLKPLFLLNILSYAYYIFKYRMLQYKQYPKQYLAMSCYWVVLLGIIIYFDMFSIFFFFWIVPYFTSFMVIGWFIEMAEHYPLVFENNKSIQMTRNRYSHWLESFFLSIHAENYHLTHHLQSSIPYWNIAKAHEIMLEDEMYRKVNSKMGGVFLSSNDNPPLIKDLIRNNKLPLQQKKVARV
ncbi:hypothetical protein BAMA_21360 [Bacillus manliponensis]|uniref:Fatty acid desaturase domain-containing protein n=1 Tax=Bacillus manliponensis TaxID=574376 RepID=A0A073JZT9_9BACI|nr:guanitoxin biosynthesis L-arginine gamma (S) hydroxylase [Bacillus manliponensis]KEK19791.1 hypothetical protein BAMA_21360 [Bacillus manliponensis]